MFNIFLIATSSLNLILVIKLMRQRRRRQKLSLWNQPQYNATYNNSSTPTTKGSGAQVPTWTEQDEVVPSVFLDHYETELQLLVQAATPTRMQEEVLKLYEERNNTGVLINFIIAYNDSHMYDPEEIRAWYQRALELTL